MHVRHQAIIGRVAFIPKYLFRPAGRSAAGDRESYDILYSMYIYKEPIMQVSKWGNSLAIRLPASVVEALELHEGDDIEVVIADERVFQVKKKPGNDAFLMRLREFRGKLPVDFKFDRDEANARS
jgi:antitoxin MazE